MQTVDEFARVAGQPVRRRAAPRPKRPITAEDLAAAPRRRSERGAGKAAVNYDESALDRVDGSRTGRAKRQGTGKALVLVQGGAHFVLDRAFGWVLAVHLTFERMQGLQRRPTHRSRLRPWGPARSPGKCLPASVLKFAPKSRVSLAYLCACRDLFVDGYDAAGQRVYDKVEGKTCHQCRQKTICRAHLLQQLPAPSGAMC